MQEDHSRARRGALGWSVDVEDEVHAVNLPITDVIRDRDRNLSGSSIRSRKRQERSGGRRDEHLATGEHNTPR
jgi:hypothetical protein